MSEQHPYPPRMNGPDNVGPHAEPPRGPADLFLEMAARIRRNDPEEFAGAILIIPPPSEDSPADPVEVLIIDPARDEAHFWHVVDKKVEIERGKFLNMQGIPRPGGYR